MYLMKTTTRPLFLAAAVIVSAFFVVVFSSPAAMIDIKLVESGERTVLERNSYYIVDCVITPVAAVSISGLQLDVEYRDDILESVSFTDRIGTIAPGIGWDTSVVNPVFGSPDGNWQTARYLKAKTAAPYWEAEDEGHVVYRLNFKVRRDAPLGETKIKFVVGDVGVIDGATGNPFSVSISHFDFEVEQDLTPPVTTANPPGGYYNTDRNVSLSINEEGEIKYRARVNGGSWSGWNTYVGAIPVTGEKDVLTVTELQFYGEDDPYQDPPQDPNVETSKTEVYYIDKEPPVISNIQAAPPIVGMGGTVDITFTVADESGLLGTEPSPYPAYVRLGGRSASRISGMNVGDYTYRLTIDGTEEDGDVVVRVRDRAGNFTTQTEQDAVVIDLEGPEFDISALPDPVYLEQFMTIDIEADKDITGLANPATTVGGEGASFDARHNARNFTYRYLMQGRNWEAMFAHLDTHPDRDGDGLPTWWEREFGLDPGCDEGDDGAAGDPDGDGWTNLAHYRFYEMTGRLTDPTDPDSGGQAIPVRAGWNLIGYSANRVWYVDSPPTGLLAGVETERVEGDDWNNFFTADRFAGSAGNLGAVRVWRGGGWKTFTPGGPAYNNDLDYIAPGEGIWVRMNSDDVLIFEGRRVRPEAGSPHSYAQITLEAGWNLVGVLPMTRRYNNSPGRSTGANVPGPNDLQYSRSYDNYEQFLRESFGIISAHWPHVETIQMLYPVHGIQAYHCDVPGWANSLNFVIPGYGAWIRVKDGQSIDIQFTEPEWPYEE